MRNLLLPEIDKLRIRTPEVLAMYGSYGDHQNGRFQWRNVYQHKMLIMASVGEGWEHVSASFSDRCPTWEDMCVIKDIFWHKEETVVQFHPRESDYISYHPYCLHLWKRHGSEWTLPPSILVGPKS